MRLLALCLFAGCAAEEPAFVTSHGVEVYTIDQATPDKTELMVDVLLMLAEERFPDFDTKGYLRDRLEIGFRDSDTVPCEKLDLLGCSTVETDYDRIEIGQAECPYMWVSHELAHLLRYAQTGDGDADHQDDEYFNYTESFDFVGHLDVRETVCPEVWPNWD